MTQQISIQRADTGLTRRSLLTGIPAASAVLCGLAAGDVAQAAANAEALADPNQQILHHWRESQRLLFEGCPGAPSFFTAWIVLNSAGIATFHAAASLPGGDKVEFNDKRPFWHVVKSGSAA